LLELSDRDVLVHLLIVVSKLLITMRRVFPELRPMFANYAPG
jgi:hypothetical protein